MAMIQKQGTFQGYSVGGKHIFVRQADGTWGVLSRVSDEIQAKLEKLYEESFADLLIQDLKDATQKFGG